MKSEIIQFLRENIIGKTLLTSVAYKLENGCLEGVYNDKMTFSNLVITENGFKFNMTTVTQELIYNLDDKGVRTTIAKDYAKYAREPEMLNIEMKDFLENEDTSDFSHTRMNIYFRELGNESPLLVKLIMQSIYKENDREIRHLGSKRFGIQFLIKGIYTYNGMLYVHTQTKNSSNVPFDTDFIRFKIVDKKVPKRTAIQETVLDAVRSYNEVIKIAGKSTVRTVYALPKFTIPDDKLLMVELYEKNGGRHQSIRVENADIVNAKEIDELKIK